MSTKSVFISRDISKTNIFYCRLAELGYEVKGQSFINFSPIYNYWSDPIDWIFFYSKTGAKFFGHHPNLPVKVGAFGPATAMFVEQMGYKVDFRGRGDPAVVATDFLKVSKGERVLFPQGKNSKKSVENKLALEIEAYEFKVYANSPLEVVLKRPEAILVFTSPMNASAYFKSHRLEDYQQVICIGETTKSVVPSMYNVFTPARPTEKSLAQKVIDIKE